MTALRPSDLPLGTVFPDATYNALLLEAIADLKAEFAALKAQKEEAEAALEE